jgi:urea transport system ATP-binding protein
MTTVRPLILQAQNLKVAFGGVQALDLALFKLKENELRVIIGPNGAGKSTFMDLICGKTKADSGKILFKDEDILGKKEVEIAQMGIGRKFQKPSVFTSLSVFDNLLLAYKMPKNVWHSMRFKLNSEITDRIHEVAKKVGLEAVLNSEAGSLSHGQKQWLEIGIVVIQNPKLMLIDEPAAGMSDTETAKTGDLILSLVEDHSVIVIEHDMNFVEQIAIENVSVLVGGKLLTEGPFQDVRADERVINSYLGKAV